MSLSLLRAVLITDPLIILATIFYGSISLAVSFFDPSGDRQLGVSREWSRMLLRIAGVRVQTSGLERLTPGASYVFASNHASYMDTPIVLGHIPARFRFLAKEELFAIPLLGGHLQRGGHIPVPKDNPRDALRAMADAGRIIREHGISILVFPEGGRSLTGLQEFREGAAYIAIKAGVPVVPVALCGSIEILPMHSVHMKSGVVELRVGEPIPTAGLTPRDRTRLTEEVRAQVAAMLR